tara:strand:- start:4256 stop:5197 length:942 start_codon:yes stop_codon:yes gene_type:complete
LSKFFQNEIGAYDGDKAGFRNVNFKKGDLSNTTAAEGGSILEIIPVHIKNPPVIQFLAYITSLSDRFDVNYNEQQPFGRTNPYYIWQGNKRSISVGIDIVSSGVSSAFDNLNNLSWLLSSLYPSFKDSVSATSVSASPLFRVRYSNLICSSTRDGQGLLCAIPGIGITHGVDQGFISAVPRNMGSSFANTAGRVLKAAGFDAIVSEGKRFLIPKVIKLDMTLNVVHDHALGWDHSTGEFRGGKSARSFPYDFGLLRAASDAGTTPDAIGGGESSAAPGSPADGVNNSNNTNIFSENVDFEGTPAASTAQERTP